MKAEAVDAAGINTNKAIVFSMGLSLAAKILNFGQSIVVSYAFGTSESTDILFYTLSIVILLTTFQGAVNHQVIVPVAIDLRTNTSEENSKRFLGFVFLIYCFIALAVTGVLTAFPVDILSFISRFPKEALAGNASILRFIIPSMLLIVLNTYMLDILTSYRLFVFPMLLDMLKNLVIILIVIGFKGVWEEKSLAIGILVGNLAQFAVLSLIMLLKIRLRVSFQKFKLSAEVIRNIGFVVTGRISTMLNDFIMFYLLSGFSAGIFSAMDYAFKIDTVINMVLVGQITTVVGIKIMELHSASRFDELRKTFTGYLANSLFFIVPICFIAALTAKPLISLLFERGNFNREDVEITAMFLRYFSLTTPLELVNGFIVLLIIAKQIQKVAFRWQIFQSLLTIVFVWLSVERYGYKAYPIAVALAFLAYMMLLAFFLLKSEFDYIGPAAVLKPYWLNTVLNLGIFGLSHVLFGKMELGAGISANLLHIGAVSVFYLSVYFGISYFTGLHRKTMDAVFINIKKILHE